MDYMRTTLEPQWSGVAVEFGLDGNFLNLLKDKDCLLRAANSGGTKARWEAQNVMQMTADSHEQIAEARQRVEETLQNLRSAYRMRRAISLLKE